MHAHLCKLSVFILINYIRYLNHYHRVEAFCSVLGSAICEEDDTLDTLLNIVFPRYYNFHRYCIAKEKEA